MKTKILFLTIYNNNSDIIYEDGGICALTSYLRHMDYEVMLIGNTMDKLDFQSVKEFGPTLIGLSIYDSNKSKMIEFAEKIKSEIPNTLICAGGFYSTYNYVGLFNESPYIDFIVKGEGEYSIYELILHLEGEMEIEDINGLIYRNNGSVVVNEDRVLIEDIDQLPIPSKDLLYNNNLKIASCFSSRGCTAACSFCSVKSFWKKWRGKPIQSFLDEIELLYNQGYRYFAMQDCSFENPGTNYNRVWEFINGVLDRKLNILYFLLFRAEFQRNATDDLMKAMKESGLLHVHIGIETGNEEDLKLYGKPAKMDDNEKVIELFNKHDIACQIGFMNFNPYSTFDRLRKNIDFLEKYNYASDFSNITHRYIPYIGTKLFNVIQNDDLMIENGYDRIDYKFLNEKVAKLFSYLANEFYDYYDREFVNIVVNYRKYLILLFYDFYATFDLEEDSDAYNLVKTYDIRINGVLSELNKKNAAWFRELLDLAENNFDKQKADLILEKHLTNKKLNESVDIIESSKLELFFKLTAIDLKYEKWLKDCIINHL